MSDENTVEKPVAPRMAGRPKRSQMKITTKTKPSVVAREESAPVEPVRREMRPAMREDDPRARAARRAAEILEMNGGDLNVNSDEFYIDPDNVPDGWSYEWRRHTVMGANDPSYEYELARNGWEPVPADRHREMMPGSAKTIDRKGMRLYERPKILVDRARSKELQAAQQHVAGQKKQLQNSSNEFGRVKPSLHNNYEPISIPN
jgi:hypothetical protein